MLSVDSDAFVCPEYPPLDFGFEEEGSCSLRLLMQRPLGVTPRSGSPVILRKLELSGSPAALLDMSEPEAGDGNDSACFFSLPRPLDLDLAAARQQLQLPLPQSTAPHLLPMALPSCAPGPYAFPPSDLAMTGPCLPAFHLSGGRLSLSPSALDRAGPDPVFLPPIHGAVRRRIRSPPPLHVLLPGPAGALNWPQSSAPAPPAPPARPLKREESSEDVDELRAKRRRIVPDREAAAAGAEVESNMTLERLAPYFAIPSTEAAVQLGISTTRLKRISRALGFARWPYRKIAALDRWSLAVRAAATLQSAGRMEPIPHFDEQALLEEVRETKAAVMARPNASVHVVVKRLNKMLLERPAKRAGVSSVEHGRRLLASAAELAAESGDWALREAFLGAVASEEADRGEGVDGDDC